MPEIELFDGTVLEFPHGTADAVMDRVAKQETASRKSNAELVQRGAEGGPVAAFGSAAANTFGLNIPRALGAAAATGLGGLGVPGFSEAWQRGYRGNYDLAKQQDEALANANPKANAAGIGAGIVGQIAAAPVTGPATAAGRLGLGAAVGGTMGAVSEGIDKGTVAGALQGGALGAAGGYAGGALGEVIGSRLAKAAGQKAVEKLAPSVDELQAASKEAYKASENAGVWYAPPSYAKFIDDAKKALPASFHPGNSPETVKAIGILEDELGNAVTLTKLDQMRKQIGGLFNKKTTSDTDEMGLMHIKRALDQFAENGDAIFGNKATGVSALKEARAAYGAQAQSETIQQAIERGKLNAEVTGSGANVDNRIRQEIRKILMKKNAQKMIPPDEYEALREAARGRNGLRLAGKMSPQHPVSAALLGILGTTVGGPAVPIAMMAGGAASKAVADRATKRAVEYAAAAPRMRMASPQARIAVELARKKALQRSSVAAALAGASLFPSKGPSEPR